ncbi:MAG TPA: hypothetical protein VFT46_07195 [Holophagaceae bacterium]|nr:hypothetical protein [Holophagaceae bacterium]
MTALNPNPIRTNERPAPLKLSRIQGGRFPLRRLNPKETEDERDVRLAMEALGAGKFTPWEKVKRDLGLE